MASGSTLDLTHGRALFWCRACVLDAQIDSAEAAAARLPGLRAEREKLRREEAEKEVSHDLQG